VLDSAAKYAVAKLIRDILAGRRGKKRSGRR
jgi:hypothetical protein